MEMAFKERERRWQHREETMMATNREREAERDLDAREKQIRRSGNNGEKVSGMGDDIEADSGQEEYYKDRSRWGFHRQQFRAHTREAMEAELNNEKEILTLSTIGASQNNSVKPELTLNLASKCRAALMALAEDEEFDDEELKLQPFVSKRIVEYLGVQEDELVSFGIDHLRNKKSAEDLTKGMMMVC
ncbi:hypothetical protein RhiirA4_411551 [Rhizophagus irregularis]|uniref:PWI domain-containing protein n=1 Tax=Rhizophagus irregularis TaxID=588596 RepID=A0A2I1HE25_9GLOM|nr:hypothetical protein RhiirA4_411551 [Rhizophagus irregularis]